MKLDDGRFRVSAAEGVAPQDCDVWCLVDGRLSNPRRFVVSNLPTVAEADGNDGRHSAQEVPFPGAVDARLESAARLDWFQFEGRAGQNLILRCRSRSLDGTVEPAVTLFAPSGREIAHSSGRRREPLIIADLPVDGSYGIRVSDRAYRKTDGSFYRLEVEAGPRIHSVFPDLVTAGRRTNVVVYGSGLPSPQETRGVLTGGVFPLERMKSALTADAMTAGRGWRAAPHPFPTIVPSVVQSVNSVARVQLSQGPVITEDESQTASVASAQLLSIPTLLNARFDRRGDVDWFAFDAKKDETFRLDLYGDRLGRQMDLDAVILDEGGKTLVTFPDRGVPKNLPALLSAASLDVSGNWKAPTDGRYRLVVRDLYGSSLFGVDRTYVLHLRRSEPSFRLIVLPPDEKSPAGYSVPQDGFLGMTVYVERRDGFDRPIVVRAAGAGESDDLTFDECRIGPGESRGLMVARGGNAARGIQFMAAVGEAASGDGVRKQPAEAITLLSPGNATARYVDRLAVAVTEPLPLGVELSTGNEVVSPGGQLKLMLKRTRLAGFLKAAAPIEFPVLPTGMKPPSVKLTPDAETFEIPVNVPKGLAAGRYSLAARVAATVIDKKATAGGEPVERAIQVWSNQITFEIQPPAK